MWCEGGGGDDNWWYADDNGDSSSGGGVFIYLCVRACVNGCVCVHAHTHMYV